MKTIKTVAVQSVLSGLVLACANLQASAAVLRVPAQYNTIQAAVDAAASGDEIRIAAGTYTEQVMVTSKDLSLVGETGVVLKAFPGMTGVMLPQDPEPKALLLGVVYCDHVSVRGLTLDGGRLADVNQGLFGVIFHGSGGGLANCTVRGFRGDPGLGPSGLGLGAANWSGLNRGLQQIEVRNNTFEDNVMSIFLGGNTAQLRLRFQVEGNVILGVGTTTGGTQTGILLREGTAGEVKHNLMAGHDYAGPELLFSFGIQATGFGETVLPIRYVENVFQDNQVHLASFFAAGAQFIANTFEGPGVGPFNIGIASSGSADQIIANRFRNLTSGVILVGDDPIFGTTLGVASNSALIGNGFCEVGTPLLSEPLVIGVQERGTRLDDCRAQNETAGQSDQD